MTTTINKHHRGKKTIQKVKQHKKFRHESLPHSTKLNDYNHDTNSFHISARSNSDPHFYCNIDINMNGLKKWLLSQGIEMSYHQISDKQNDDEENDSLEDMDFNITIVNDHYKQEQKKMKEEDDDDNEYLITIVNDDYEIDIGDDDDDYEEEEEEKVEQLHKKKTDNRNFRVKS